VACGVSQAVAFAGASLPCAEPERRRLPFRDAAAVKGAAGEAHGGTVVAYTTPLPLAPNEIGTV